MAAELPLVDGGLSPRGRGNQEEGHSGRRHRGAIPARAGEPRFQPCSRTRSRGYPRAGGGTGVGATYRLLRKGLSPRGRGNRQDAQPDRHQAGAIPARAGEPRRAPRARRVVRGYPRAGGGTFSRINRPRFSRGLSPRGRGNLAEHRRQQRLHGAIPARAGEPRFQPCSRTRSRGYPRAGGGTDVESALTPDTMGLSPRGRGNRRHLGRRPRGAGAIPARAGEPIMTTARAAVLRGYPRAGGGTMVTPGNIVAGTGLSPRRRGNRSVVGLGRFPVGAIPARAGEPRPCRPGRRPTGGYPRAGGGTTRFAQHTDCHVGLSPRGRGNPRRMAGVSPARRAIPARAGEPRRGRRRHARPRGYPRAGGGTWNRLPWPRRAGGYPRAGGGTISGFRSRPPLPGLSPRGRGNLSGSPPRLPIRGAIPARAGEPPEYIRVDRNIRGYPRAGGGTKRSPCCNAIRGGLSPRGRGNRVGRRFHYPIGGAIPARAGEPIAGHRESA